MSSSSVTPPGRMVIIKTDALFHEERSLSTAALTNTGVILAGEQMKVEHEKSNSDTANVRKKSSSFECSCKIVIDEEKEI